MTADPARVEEVLVDLVPGIFRSGWALLLTQAGSTLTVKRASGGAPEADGYEAPWLPLREPTRIAIHNETWAPESWHDVVAVGVPIADSEQAVVFGRDGGPRILDSELARLIHLVALAQVIRRSVTPFPREAFGEDEPVTSVSQPSFGDTGPDSHRGTTEQRPEIGATG
jgi:hypothetical protein